MTSLQFFIDGQVGFGQAGQQKSVSLVPNFIKESGHGPSKADWRGRLGVQSDLAEPPALEPHCSPPLFAPRNPRLVARVAGSLAASGDGCRREVLKRRAPVLPRRSAVSVRQTP
jgi:hypothetical protein